MEAVPKKWPLWKFCYFGFFFAARHSWFCW